MERESITSRMTLQQLVKEQRRVTAIMHEYAEYHRHRCLCGKCFADIGALNDHRSRCALLRAAIVGDIRRVSGIVRRTPTRLEYDANRLPELLSATTVVVTLEIFETWNDAIVAAGLPVTRMVTAKG